jgi:hypothetical protein
MGTEYTTEMTYWESVAIAFDQLINAIFKGYPDMTLSARCYRWHLSGKRSWAMHLVNCIFFWQNYNHCEMAYKSELDRIHMPEDMRKQRYENI